MPHRRGHLRLVPPPREEEPPPSPQLEIEAPTSAPQLGFDLE